MKNERQQFAKYGAISGLRPENRRRVTAPGVDFALRIRGQPASFTKNRQNIGGRERTRGDGAARFVIRSHRKLHCTAGDTPKSSGGSSAPCFSFSQTRRQLTGECSPPHKRLDTLATTGAANALPRPIASTPSLVLAFRLIFCARMPIA